MIGAPLIFAIAATVSPPSSAAPFGYQRLRLGDSVAHMISGEGPPNVLTTDVGHIWTWERGDERLRLTTDDDGVIRMIDILPSQSDHLTLPLPGSSPKSVTFGTLTSDAADEQLGMPADFKGLGNFPDSAARAEFRAYRLTANENAVLLFDNSSKRLTELFYGDRRFLARSGLLPGAPESVAQHYSAPVLQRQGNADYPPTIKEGDAYLRVSVDKHGTVANAEIFVTSGDPQLDRAALVSARHDIFSPASLEGMPVDAVVFVRQEFRQLQTH